MCTLSGSGTGGGGAGGGPELPCGATSIADEPYACIQTIAQKAAEAYAAKGALCTTAISQVPPAPPPGVGTPYTPSGQANSDYQVGSSDAGWICLGFEQPLPQHYMLTYRMGGAFLVEPPPCPTGECFEAAAQGDLDYDEFYSQYAIYGIVDQSGTLLLTPPVVKNPGE